MNKRIRNLALLLSGIASISAFPLKAIAATAVSKDPAGTVYVSGLTANTPVVVEFTGDNTTKSFRTDTCKGFKVRATPKFLISGIMNGASLGTFVQTPYMPLCKAGNLTQNKSPMTAPTAATVYGNGATLAASTSLYVFSPGSGAGSLVTVTNNAPVSRTINSGTCGLITLKQTMRAPIGTAINVSGTSYTVPTTAGLYMSCKSGTVVTH